MKRAPRLFYLILLLNSEERRLVLKELIRAGNINLSGYLIPLLNCSTKEDMRNKEKQWVIKNNASSSYLWQTRNRAYWFIIEVINNYRGSGIFMNRVLHLYRVDTYLRLRDGSDNALPNAYEILPPDRKEAWFFFKAAWWFEYSLRIYGHSNWKYTDETVVDEAYRAVQVAYFAFKLFSACRRSSTFQLLNKQELENIVKDVNSVLSNKPPFHFVSILYFMGISFAFSRSSMWNSLSQLFPFIFKWANEIYDLGKMVQNKYRSLRQDAIAFKATWHFAYEWVYNLPEMSLFTDVTFLSNHKTAEPLSLSATVRKAWWLVMNGKYYVGHLMFDTAKQSLNIDKWPYDLKKLYYISMAWIYFVRHRNKEKTLSLIKQINPRPKSVLNMLSNIYKLFYAIENHDFSEARRSAESIYRYSVRNNLILPIAKAIRWLGKHLDASNETTLWHMFKDKLKEAYLQQPWNLHIERIIPIRLYVESKVNRIDIALIDNENDCLKWFSASQLQQYAELIYGFKIDTSLIIKRAEEFSEMLQRYLKDYKT